jgi:hypothetical protein
MTALTSEERKRYEVLRAKLEGAVVGVEELADGYSLQLSGGGLAPVELDEWILFERKCCPFFRLVTDGQAEALKSRITGGDGVKDFIRAEFSAIRFE